MYDLKLWPNVPPDVKYNSSTLGKIEPILNQEQILNNTTNKTIVSPTTNKLPVIKWNDESEYPMLDELSRISKVRKRKKKFLFYLNFFLVN
jgi:hypothetical protein